MNITGIILAGGNSTRMGKDKGLMDFKGKPLVQSSIDLLSIFTDQIIISSNQPGYDQFGFQVVRDEYQNCGPIGGIHAALKYSQNDWNIVIGCDMPFLNPALFEQMLKQTEGFDLIIASHLRGIEPLAGLYHKNLCSVFEECILNTDYKLVKILAQQKVFYFDANPLLVEHPHLFDNFNSPHDLNLKIKS